MEEITGTPAKPPMPPSVSGVKLRDALTGAVTDMPIDGVFVAIGHAPAVELFKGKLKLKSNGYLWTAPDSTATDVPGIFAAGDVTDDVYRQAITAAGMGCMAALEAETLPHRPACRNPTSGGMIAMRGGGMPLDWDKLRIFHAAAEAGSFTHAATSCICRSRPSAARCRRWSRISASSSSIAMPAPDPHRTGRTALPHGA